MPVIPIARSATLQPSALSVNAVAICPLIASPECRVINHALHCYLSFVQVPVLFLLTYIYTYIENCLTDKDILPRYLVGYDADAQRFDARLTKSHTNPCK